MHIVASLLSPCRSTRHSSKRVNLRLHLTSSFALACALKVPATDERGPAVYRSACLEKLRGSTANVRASR